MFKESKKPQASIICEIYVVSNDFFTKILTKYEQQFKIWADSDASSRKELLASADDLRLSSGSNASIDDDENDDLRSSSSSAKNKKKQRRNKGNKKKKSNSSNVKDLVDQYTDQNKGFLKEWEPEMPENLIENIVIQLHSRLIELRESAARAIFMDSNEKKKFDENEWQVEVKQTFHNIMLFFHALNDFSGDSDSLEKHLLRTLCTDLAHLLIKSVAIQNFIKLDNQQIETVKQRNLALKKLQKLSPIHDYLTTMCGTLSKSCKDFFESLDPIFDALGILIKPLDKRSEK